jgi:hypothetical protein
MRKRLIAAACLIGLVACGFGGYHLYDNHHLSSDLKHTLRAAMDPNTSVADDRIYIRDARLQVRTKLDAQVLAKVERLEAITDADAERSRLVLNRQQNLGKSETVNRLVATARGYRAHGLPVPKSLSDDIDQAIDEDAEKTKELMTWADREEAKDHAETNKLYPEVLSDLGLPPVKSP